MTYCCSRWRNIGGILSIFFLLINCSQQLPSAPKTNLDSSSLSQLNGVPLSFNPPDSPEVEAGQMYYVDLTQSAFQTTEPVKIEVISEPPFGILNIVNAGSFGEIPSLLYIASIDHIGNDKFSFRLYTSNRSSKDITLNMSVVGGDTIPPPRNFSDAEMLTLASYTPGSIVTLTDRSVSAIFSDRTFYVGHPANINGIRVFLTGINTTLSKGLKLGDRVSVTGTIKYTYHRERPYCGGSKCPEEIKIEATDVIITDSTKSEVKPYYMIGRTVSGYRTPGLNNTGMLVKISGQVVCQKFTGIEAGFWLDDGSSIFETPSIGTTSDSVSGIYVKSVVTGNGVVVSADGSKIYTATDNGLAITTEEAEGSFSYDNKTASDGLGSDDVKAVYVSTDGLKVFSATTGGLSLSSDGGLSFYANKKTTDGLGSNLVQGIHLSGTMLYAATSEGLSLSSNGGSNFSATKTTGNGLGSNDVRGVYTSGTMLYAATANGLSLSSNGGSDFYANKMIGNSLGSNDVRGVFAFGAMVYVATTNGLSVSSNYGSSYSNTLAGVLVYGVYVTATSIFAATDKGVLVSSSDLSGASFVLDEDGLGNYYGLGNNDQMNGLTYAEVSCSSAAGVTCSSAYEVRGVFASTDDSKVYAATGGGGLSYSIDYGMNYINHAVTMPVFRSKYIFDGDYCITKNTESAPDYVAAVGIVSASIVSYVDETKIRRTILVRTGTSKKQWLTEMKNYTP